MPASLPRLRIIWAMPLSVIAARPLAPSHSAGSSALRVPGTGAQVAIERLRGPRAERARPWAPTLAGHDRDVVAEVDVVDPQLGQLAEAHAGVEEQAHDRGVASRHEPGAGARLQQCPSLVLAEHGNRALGHDRRPHLGHRIGVELLLIQAPGEELLECPKPHGGSRCRTGLDLLGDEVLDVMALDLGHALDACSGHVIDQLACGFEVGLDGLGRQVAGPQRPLPRGQERPQIVIHSTQLSVPWALYKDHSERRIAHFPS